MVITARVSPQDVTRLKNLLSGIQGGVDKALSRAVNKSLVNVRTEMVKQVGQHLNLPAKRIKKDFKEQKANYGNPNAWIKIKSRPPGLIEFGSRQLKRGVSVKVLKSGSRVKWKHAFIADMRGPAKQNSSFANTHMLIRVNPYVGTAPWRPNFPYGVLPEKYKQKIVVKYGPRVASVFTADRSRLDAVEALAAERISINLAYEAEAILRRYA